MVRVLYVDEGHFNVLRSNTFLLLFIASLFAINGISSSYESNVGALEVFASIISIASFVFCLVLFFVFFFRARRFGVAPIYLWVGCLLLIISVVLEGLFIWYVYFLPRYGVVFPKKWYLEIFFFALCFYVASTPIFLFLKIILDFKMILEGKIMI